VKGWAAGKTGRIARCVSTWRVLVPYARASSPVSFAREGRLTYGPFGRSEAAVELARMGAHGARGGRRVGEGLGVRIVLIDLARAGETEPARAPERSSRASRSTKARIHCKPGPRCAHDDGCTQRRAAVRRSGRGRKTRRRRCEDLGPVLQPLTEEDLRADLGARGAAGVQS
jgi:hypothetical protein